DLSIHTSPEAFGSHSRGSPPSTGTTQVSQSRELPFVYAIRDPSGEKTGLIFGVSSCVSCTGSPLGSIFTYTCPGPRKVLGPRMKVSMRPSGESAGWLTESAKFVICTHSVCAGAGGLCFSHQKAATAAEKTAAPDRIA